MVETPAPTRARRRPPWAHRIGCVTVPAGCETDRLYGFAREEFLEEHPDVVVAFLLALQDARREAVGATRSARPARGSCDG